MYEKIGAINGLRGLAILGVVWHHLFSVTLTPPGTLSAEFLNVNLLPLTIFSNGWLGVNLFFVLSGFVLTYPFVFNRRSMESYADCRHFYTRRIRRLMPLFYFSLVVLLAIDFFVAGKIPVPQDLLLYLTATFNFNAATFFPPVNWVLWSLGIEIWFSILFPLLLVGAARIGMSRLLVLVLILSLLVRVLGNEDAGGNLYLSPAKDGLFGRLDDFVVGMWLCQLYREPPKWRPSPTAVFGIGVFAILLVCTVWDYVVLGIVPMTVRPVLNNVFQIGVACIIYAMVIADRPRWLNWILSRKLQILGLMTYSIYIWHGRLIALIDNADGVSGRADIVRLLLYLGTLLLVSIASYRFIEFWHVRDTRRLFATSR